MQGLASPPRRARRALTAAAVFLLAAGGGASSASASLATSLARALDVPGVSASSTGAMAFDLSTSAIVYRQNAKRSLRPASNEKLTVAVAALSELRPTFRIPTDVLGRGRLAEGTWHGPLYLRGYGDPVLTRLRLARLAQRVEDAGIRRVTGAIVGDESYFDKRRTAPGWNASYYKEESPPLSALVVDRARLGGQVVDEPARAAAVLFKRKLRAIGVAVAGRARTGTTPLDAVRLTRKRSPSLAVLVRRMNRRSDNFVAEMLLKQLGARSLGAGTTAAGAQVVTSELVERGVSMDGVRIVDGSGLSRYDRLTARALTELLISAFSDGAISAPFVASLPVAGRSGTLRDRMTKPPARGNVYAKTGTTRRASSLSGYVKKRYVFSILMNGDPIALYAARRGQDRFATVLADAAQ